MSSSSTTAATTSNLLDPVDRRSTYIKSHPALNGSYDCDDVFYIKSILLQSRKVADNIAYELIKPSDCSAARERFDTVSQFRRALLQRCLQSQRTRLTEAANASAKDAVAKLRFYEAELETEAILDATVARKVKAVCRNVN